MAQSTSNASKTEKPGNRPAHTIRYGAVRAAIWRNVVDNGNFPQPLVAILTKLNRSGIASLTHYAILHALAPLQ